MRVLAIDPGGTTGWAEYAAGWPDPVEAGQLAGGLHGVQELMIRLPRLDVLVIERYTISVRTAKFSRQSDALKITGLLEFHAAAQGVPVVFQPPGEAMRLFTDKRLKEFGWWPTGQDHARDALRHLGLYLAKQGEIKLTDPGWRRADG